MSEKPYPATVNKSTGNIEICVSAREREQIDNAIDNYVETLSDQKLIDKCVETLSAPELEQIDNIIDNYVETLADQKLIDTNTTLKIPKGPLEDHREQLNNFYTFKFDSALYKYIQEEKIEMPIYFTLSNLLTSVHNHVFGKTQAADTNPPFFLCDEEIEKLPLKQLIKTQINRISDPLQTILTNATNKYKKRENAELCYDDDDAMAPSPKKVKINQEMEADPNSDSDSEHPNSDSDSSTCGSLETTILHTKYTRAAGLAFIKKKPDFLNPKALFYLSTALEVALKKLPNFPENCHFFTYDEICSMVSQYILMQKEKIFDERNILVAVVKEDPLGTAFGVDAFHRCQVTSLLRKQIIYAGEKVNYINYKI